MLLCSCLRCYLDASVVGFVFLVAIVWLVWHQGLLYKLKKKLPDQIFLIINSYINDRYFQVKIENILFQYYPVQAGVPQGSVLGPLLYLFFTADIPTKDDTLIATVADDTAKLSPDINPNRASDKLQLHLNVLQTWLELMCFELCIVYLVLCFVEMCILLCLL